MVKCQRRSQNSCWAYQWRARQEPRQISHVTMTFSWSEAWHTDLCWQTLFLHCFVSHLAAKVRDMYNTTGCVIETPHIKQHRLLMMKWCLMSSDVGWHIRDQLRPMPKHGSIYLYVHGKPEGSLGRTAQDGQLDSHSSWTMSTGCIREIPFIKQHGECKRTPPPLPHPTHKTEWGV